ncbi:MAG: hypothetical protein AAF702_28900 [Chloroflexota bacterium]
MEKKLNFNQCTLPLLDKTFGTRRVHQSNILDEWLNRALAIDLSDFEKQSCVELRSLLHANADSWQEQELSLHFIGPMFSMVKLTDLYRYNLFAQRHIEATIDDILLAGEPDGLIASGYYEPEIPYFAFSEYKRQRDPNGDPIAQALAAMLVGQTLNHNKHPVYGCYVIGRDWNFMVLENSFYTTSRDFSGLSDEVFDILRILKALKEIVIELTA